MGSEYRDDEETLIREIPPLTDDEEDQEPDNPNFDVQSSNESTEHTLPVPIWLRESAKSFKFRWVPLPLRKAGRAIVKFVKGPNPPYEWKINPIFPKIQQAPIRLLDRYVPNKKYRILLFIILHACWFLTWSLMLKFHARAGHVQGYGQPTNLWCGANFWNKDNGCGINGNDCRPFSSAHLTFRCPANCKATHMLQPYMVGNETVQYTGLVVGGRKANDSESMPVYRADSFICQAAIHAGVITDSAGGCGVATLVGEHTGFDATNAHGIKSLGFPSTFPRTYTFQRLSKGQAQCPSDSQWGLFAVTATSLIILSLFTTSPVAFFFSTFLVMMFHVGLVSDHPNLPNFSELLSMLFSRLLPATFVMGVMYWFAALPLLGGLTAQFEKTVLYLGFCFFGALNNFTFAVIIPIQRLTPHDLAQPGAKFALAIIISIVVVIVIGQIYVIRLSGKMPRYLALYVTMGVSLLILLALPDLQLRIHHYILALLFMPGTGFQTRPGLAYQGLLLGLFINGIARWGFDSIIQTPAALGDSNGGHGGGSWWGATSPNVTAFVAPDASNITLNWGNLPNDTGIDGVSILINDVERWRGYTDEELFWNDDHVTLRRRRREKDEPEFFRFAWMNGNSAGLYSKVAIWDENGVWHDMPEE